MEGPLDSTALRAMQQPLKDAYRDDPGQALITRMEAGGNFFTISQMVLSEYDLAGHKTLETNVEILNEQLAASATRQAP